MQEDKPPSVPPRGEAGLWFMGYGLWLMGAEGQKAPSGSPEGEDLGDYGLWMMGDECQVTREGCRDIRFAMSYMETWRREDMNLVLKILLWRANLGLKILLWRANLGFKILLWRAKVLNLHLKSTK